MNDLTRPGLQLHPLREQLYDELHSRPFQQIEAPARITRRLADNGGVDEAGILGELTAMAARVEDFRARSTFRFGATQAYHELVLGRLRELREDEVSGHLTLNEFIGRRIHKRFHALARDERDAAKGDSRRSS